MRQQWYAEIVRLRVNNQERTEPSIAPAPASDPQLVLIVDDERDVCEMLTRMLKRLGIVVLYETDPQLGVELFRVHAPTVKCVLLDLSMPQMRGDLVFAELQRIKSDVRVIVMSGYSADIALHSFSERQLAGFLPKPFSFADLKAALQDLCRERTV